MGKASSMSRPEDTPFPLITRQKAVELSLWCRQCGLLWEYVIPATMRPSMVTCAGCEIDGFLELEKRKRP